MIEAKAKSPASIETIDLGRKAAIAIENARNVFTFYYGTELNTPLPQISRSAKACLQQIEELFQHYQQNLGAIEAKVSSFFAQIPFNRRMPRLREAPKCILIDDPQKDVFVLLRGYFPYADRQGYAATLTLANRACELIDATTDCLTFSVAQSLFVTESASPYSCLRGKLVVPWDNGWVRSLPQTFEYDIAFAALQTAGHMHVIFESTQKERIRKEVSKEFSFSGNTHTLGNHDIYQSVEPEPGWLIDISSRPVLKCTNVSGMHEPSIVTKTDNQIVFKVRVQCDSVVGKPSQVIIRLNFAQIYHPPASPTRYDFFPLKWCVAHKFTLFPMETIQSAEFTSYEGTKMRIEEALILPREPSLPPISINETLSWQIDEDGRTLVANPPSHLQMQEKELPLTLKEKLARFNKLAHLSKLTDNQLEKKGPKNWLALSNW